ncbi:MAG: hypothetical protein KBS95_06395 [Alistipes sp.]|nr:hypothetical protein [Candidatus Alistipes equi]
MSNLSKSQIREFLISKRLDDLIEFLMTDLHLSLEEAMDKVYRSQTIKRLQDPEGELYVQSSAYIHELLLQEVL